MHKNKVSVFYVYFTKLFYSNHKTIQTNAFLQLKHTCTFQSSCSFACDINEMLRGKLRYYEIFFQLKEDPDYSFVLKSLGVSSCFIEHVNQ